MRRLAITMSLLATAALGVGAAVVLGDTTGEHVACATATATAPGVTVPDHTIGADGTPVYTFPGQTTEGSSDAQTACVTATDTTITLPGSTTTVVTTTTVPVTTTVPTTTTAPTTTTVPPPAGYPNASNTGVTNPSAVVTYTGPNTITTAGTTLTNKLFTQRLNVNAANVTIRNSLFRFTSFVMLDLSHSTGFLIEDSEFDGMGSDDGFWSGVGWTGRRLNIHGSEDGGKMSAGLLVDSYIHDMKLCSTCHSDGIQIMGSDEPTTVIRHNTIADPPPPQFGNGAFQITPELCCGGPIFGVTVDNNLLSGGGYTFRVHQRDNFTTTVALTNNHFVRNSYQWGPISLQEDNPGKMHVTCSGNVFHDNLQPLNC